MTGHIFQCLDMVTKQVIHVISTSVLPSGDPSLSSFTALGSYLATQGPTECTLFRLQTAVLTRRRLNHLLRDLASRCGA